MNLLSLEEIEDLSGIQSLLVNGECQPSICCYTDLFEGSSAKCRTKYLVATRIYTSFKVCSNFRRAEQVKLD